MTKLTQESSCAHQAEVSELSGNPKLSYNLNESSTRGEAKRSAGSASNAILGFGETAVTGAGWKLGGRKLSALERLLWLFSSVSI